jgi:hypothetical protein
MAKPDGRTKLVKAAKNVILFADRWVDKGGNLPLFVALSIDDLRVALDPKARRMFRPPGAGPRPDEVGGAPI